MRNNVITAIVLSLAAVFGSVGAAHAALIISPNVADGTWAWEAEAGQSMPTDTPGYVQGSLNLDQAGAVTFTYGAGILAGDTGHGNSIFLNEFWVGANEAAARLAGDIFCTQAITGVCGASSVGNSFAIFLPVGAIDFGFSFDQGNGTGGHTLLNGQSITVDPIGSETISNDGAYMAQIDPIIGALNAGPGTLAYVGLADSSFAALDHDFQNMVVSVSVPEPSSVALLGLALAGLGFVRRRLH